MYPSDDPQLIDFSPPQRPDGGGAPTLVRCLLGELPVLGLTRWLGALCCGVAMMGSHAATPVLPDSAQFVQLFFPPTLLAERMRARLAVSLVDSTFSDAFHDAYTEPIQPVPGMYSEQDLKKMLLEIDRLTSQYMRSVTPAPSEMVGIVAQKMPKYDLSSSGRFFLEGSVENVIAREDTKFMGATVMWPAYFKALSWMAPDLFGKPVKEAPPSRDDKHLLFYETRGWAYGRRYIDEFLRSNRAAGLLPGKPDLTGLRQQDVHVLSLSKALIGTRQYPVHDFRFDMFEMVESKAMDLWFPNGIPSIEEDAKTLNGRLMRAADPMKSGACKGSDLNAESVIDSQGDWTKVRTRSNASLDPKNSSAFGGLVKYYERGCFVKKDLALARGLLEQWAKMHGDLGKLANHTHCKLALWLRNGVGGKRDTAAGQRWEERAMRETGVGCSYPDRLRIDPRDPWSDLQ